MLREWIGVSDEPAAARDAFCSLLEASPAGLASLEFASNSKGHWKRTNIDRPTFERVVALAAEDHRRAAVISINLSEQIIGGVRVGCLEFNLARTVSKEDERKFGN